MNLSQDLNASNIDISTQSINVNKRPLKMSQSFKLMAKNNQKNLSQSYHIQDMPTSVDDLSDPYGINLNQTSFQNNDSQLVKETRYNTVINN